MYISAAPEGAVVAHQRDRALDLVWIDADHCVQSAPTISLAGLGFASRYDLRGMAMFDDRIVLASGGNGTTTLRVLDQHGTLLTRHDCHAGLFRPGQASLARVGDDVVVTNLLAGSRGAPVCAGQLHGKPRWRELTLPGGRLLVRDGVVYFQGADGAILATPRALDSNLQPTVPDPHAKDEVASDDYCSGLTGEALDHEEKIHDRIFVHMMSCCGGPPGGLFVCKPRSENRAMKKSAFKTTAPASPRTADSESTPPTIALVIAWSASQPHRVGEVAHLPFGDRLLVGRGDVEAEESACFARQRPGQAPAVVRGSHSKATPSRGGNSSSEPWAPGSISRRLAAARRM